MKTSYDIIIKPIVTEASMANIEVNKYTFKVRKDVNKTEIKKAIEELFSVDVVKVNTLMVKGKVKRLGRTEGRRPNWKKAIVTLAPGSKIELFEGMV
ncbi:MAG: 50S ribosomal protein L23 [Bacillota bacterium]|nr:50S ribosomal protein L23 [Bacillota bacterium]